MWVIPQAAKIRAAIREYANADGIIIDLRGNPGGVGGLAGGVAGLLSDKQMSLGTMTSRLGTMSLLGYPQPDPFLKKIVVLTDHGSGSTSEMFAAGIQENARGKVIGETSAGAILLAMGLSMPEAVGGLRLTLSPQNTPAEVDKLLEVLPGVVSKLRSLTPAR